MNKQILVFSIIGILIGSVIGLFFIFLSIFFNLYQSVIYGSIFSFLNLLFFFGGYVLLYVLVFRKTGMSDIEGLGEKELNTVQWVVSCGLLGAVFGSIVGLIFNFELIWIIAVMIPFIILSLIPFLNFIAIGVACVLLGRYLFDLIAEYRESLLFMGSQQHNLQFDVISCGWEYCVV